jgi:putative hemolysin
MAAQIAALPERQLLSRNAELSVFVASRQQAPAVIAEIGRLREITFRSVGEGTGRATDLDRFDDYYEHLFIWNDAKREIAGAYRLGRSDEILRVSGLNGLYTHGLFRFAHGFFDQLRPALELGRSFVRLEYQRSFAPLLLLWKAIAAYVARHPQYSVLFGAVSISNDYHPLSKEFLRDYLSREHYADELARCVKPRNRLRRRMTLKTLIHPWAGPQSLESLSDVVSTLEADGKGIPVLLRQYLKLGGKIVGFNVDPEFSDSIDCLLVVDLRTTDLRVLEKYMGKADAARFLLEQPTSEQR